MPRNDGTGPMGQTGGRGLGSGRGQGMPGGSGFGPGGNCYCPSCGTTVEHTQGLPCNQRTCPKCGKTMSRK